MPRLFLAVLLFVAGCATVNSQTVKTMPSGELCNMLNPNIWTLSSQERSVIYAELDSRGHDCVFRTGTSKKAFE